MNNISQINKESLLLLKDITSLVNIPTLVLSEKVIAQISYYHHKVKGSEWSGPLIYSRTGADDVLKLFKEGSNETMELRAEDILIADIGSPGFTSYKLDEPSMMTRVQDYQLAGYHLSHCHSHQNMRTFFSGTDNEELQENTPNHKMYLSLIVNYLDGGDFTARICCKTTEKIPVLDYLKDLRFFNKKKQEVDLSDIFSEREVIYYINIPVTYGLDKLTLDRYDAVVEEKKPKYAQEHFPSYGTGFNGKYGGGAAGWSKGTNHYKGRQLSILDFDDKGELIDDKFMEIEEDPNFGLSISRVNLLDYIYRIFSLDLDSKSHEIGLPKIHELFKNINTKFTKSQLEDIECNLENMTEYIIELVWGEGKLFTVDDDQIFEIIEEANALIKKEFSSYKKVTELFDDFYVFSKESLLEDSDSPFVDTKITYKTDELSYLNDDIYGR